VSGAWKPPARCARALALYAAAEADRKTRPERYALDSEALAVRALGDDDARKASRAISRRRPRTGA
jgi:hypothetical protein